MSHRPDDPVGFSSRALLCFPRVKHHQVEQQPPVISLHPNVAVTSTLFKHKVMMQLEHARTDLLEFPAETQSKLKRQVTNFPAERLFVQKGKLNRRAAQNRPLTHCRLSAVVAVSLACLG